MEEEIQNEPGIDCKSIKIATSFLEEQTLVLDTKY
jgi:hypothetical protein